MVDAIRKFMPNFEQEEKGKSLLDNVKGSSLSNGRSSITKAC